MASYRPLFSRLLSSAIKKKQPTINGTTTETTITTKDNKNFTIDPGTSVGSEDLSKIIVKESGYILNGLIPYNGALINNKPEKYIQMVTFDNESWLRTRVTLLGSKYTPTTLELVSGWKTSPNVVKSYSEIKESLFEFYSVRSNVTAENKEEIFKYNTVFYNPKYRLDYTLKTDVNPTTNKFDGAVHSGPGIEDTSAGQFGIAMNAKLMKKLKLNDGDVVYFKYTK
jgi:hypothetical protein